MLDDMRYSELRFLQAVQKRQVTWISSDNTIIPAGLGISHDFYFEMIAMMLEEMYVSFDKRAYQEIVWKLRGEHTQERPFDISEQQWIKPRTALNDILRGQVSYELKITYRGIRRIEELRDLLKRDRILEDFGILLSIRYLNRDLQDALNRPADVSVAVIYADMDDFGPINKTYGHDAGDEVMKAYLAAVRDAIGDFGTAYRGVGDETVSIIIGQDRARVSSIANDICHRVRSIKIEYKDKSLPPVTASVGVAISPPGPRSREVQTLADERQKEAKRRGKNQFVGD